jgi:uncharacterized OB-fold protein
VPDLNKAFTSNSFYEFLRLGRLMGTKCSNCSDLSIRPRPICFKCHSQSLEWTPFIGFGSLSTYTIIAIPPTIMANRGYGRSNPYCSGIITLEEGPRVSGFISGVDCHNPNSIEVGMLLKIDFSKMWDESPTIMFIPR